MPETTYFLDRLENGVCLVLAHMPARASVALGLYCRRGSRSEPLRYQGLAHFVEHAVFKGTRRRSARRISLDAEAVGGSLNAFTAEEHTCYHVKAPAEHAAAMTDLLADLYRNARFHPRDINLERRVIEDEILLYHEQPSSHVEDLLAKAAWPAHPLGRSILGSVSSLNRINSAKLSAYAAGAHTGANTILAAAGRMDFPELKRLARRHLEGLPAGRRHFPRPYVPPRRRTPAILAEERPLQQTHLALAFHAGGWQARDAADSRVLSAILGETMSSLLQQELRERRGICYDISSQRDFYAETGLLSIYAAMEGSRFPEALQIIIRVLRRLREKAPAPRTVDQAVSCLIGQNALAMEDTGAQMFWVGDLVAQERTQLDPAYYENKLREVRAQGVSACARRTFRPGNAAAAVLGIRSDEHKQLLLKSLRELI
ncbi:MAG TPA: pitrilysin family protein [Verrucomicrobiales bacterium]|nr:pitrilysin family protein [Verrucomicrobiales bacterium]